jgi:hypothetical protein
VQNARSLRGIFDKKEKAQVKMLIFKSNYAAIAKKAETFSIM